MKKRALVFSLLVCLCSLGYAENSAVPAPYVIVLSKEASISEKWAAKDLAEHLNKMTGLEFAVTGEEKTIPEKAILIGDSAAVKALGVNIDAKKLGTDGFVLKKIKDRVIIAGGRVRGTMYGVYELLEKMGCRWWAPGESTIPQLAKLVFPAVDLEKIPVLEYRDLLYGDLWLGRKEDPDSSSKWYEGRQWCARNRIHASYHEMPDELAPIAMDRAIAHGVTKYLPKDVYFETHPEYYCLIKGKRLANQPCWTNEEAIKLAAKNALAVLDQHPGWKLITLGQEDDSMICQCETCAALVKKHVNSSALVVYFINGVARIVKEKYPEVWLNTNAYSWSQAAPVGIKCEDNVMITIPPIRCNYAQPLEEGFPKENSDYKKDVEDWSKLCKKFYVWGYTTNFVNYVMPWPNFFVIQPNIKWLVSKNIRGIFEQGSHTMDNGQFSKLCMWLEAKAMWEPDLDGRELVKEFCLGYYGSKAGPLIWEYINMLEDKVIKEHLPIWSTHRTFLSAPHLTPEIISAAEQKFRQAEKLAKAEPDILRRVQVAHFSVQLMFLMRPYVYWDAAKKLNPEMSFKETVEQFVRTGRENGISAIREGDKAQPLYDWALDYLKLIETDPAAGLPEELKKIDPKKYLFLYSAQFDQKSKSLFKADGALSGWAQKVTIPGWAITNALIAPKDFTPGKKYKGYFRYKGQAAPGAAGKSFTVAIYTAGKNRTCGAEIDAKLMDGKWHVADMGTWSPDENGGSLFAALTKPDNFKTKNEKGEELQLPAYIDSFWLVEVESDKK